MLKLLDSIFSRKRTQLWPASCLQCNGVSLAGDHGWGARGDLPTSSWVLPNPVILTSAPSFGLRTNQFGFTISWATNASVVVEASTNLANPTWSPVGTNTLIDGFLFQRSSVDELPGTVLPTSVALRRKAHPHGSKSHFSRNSPFKVARRTLKNRLCRRRAVLAAAVGAACSGGSQDYTYYTNNGTITITGYIGSGGAVSIPSMLDDMPVTGIESSAFNSSFRLTSVAIPGSVTRIGNWAFNNCTNLTSVTIGNGLTNIGERAFSYCRNLTNVAIPDSVTLIQGEVFLWCSSLPNITIPKSVMMIMPKRSITAPT